MKTPSARRADCPRAESFAVPAVAFFLATYREAGRQLLTRRAAVDGISADIDADAAPEASGESASRLRGAMVRMRGAFAVLVHAVVLSLAALAGTMLAGIAAICLTSKRPGVKRAKRDPTEATAKAKAIIPLEPAPAILRAPPARRKLSPAG